MRWKEGCVALGLAAIVGGLFFLQNQIILSYNHWPAQSLNSLSIEIVVQWMWVALVYPIYWVVRKNRLEEHGWLRLVAVHASASIVIAQLHGYLTYGLLYSLMTLLHQPMEPLTGERAVILSMHFDKFFSYSMILVLCYGLDFWQRCKWQQVRLARLGAHLAQTNFEMIRMQLSPGMLFATLDSIAVRMRDTIEVADSIIERLGDYLRLLLQTAGNRFVPLHEEMAITQAYLELWQLRLERVIQVDWELAPETLGDLIPKDLLRCVFEEWCGAAEKNGEVIPVLVVSRRAGRLLEIEITGAPFHCFSNLQQQPQVPGVRVTARNATLCLLITPQLPDFRDSDFVDQEDSVAVSWKRRPLSRATRNFTRGEKIWLWSFAIWSLFAALFFARVMFVARHAGVNVVWLDVFLNSMQLYMWALLTPWIISFTRAHPVTRATFKRSIPALIGQNIVLWIPFIASNVLFLWAREGALRQAVLDTIFTFQYATETMIYAGVVVFGHALLWRTEWMNDRVQTSRLQAQLIQARMTALKMQLHPHFVFNTLNSISELMRQDVDAASQMIHRLKEFLTLTLERSATFEVTLAEELIFLRNYLAIQQVRFQDRLRVQIQIQDGANQRKVPNLILQPIVENAIRYGISAHKECGEILICARQSNGHLQLEVKDDGPGMRKNFHEGVGLSNTRTRLKQFYGDDYLFEFRNAPGGGLRVTLEIPAA